MRFAKHSMAFSLFAVLTITAFWPHTSPFGNARSAIAAADDPQPALPAASQDSTTAPAGRIMTCQDIDTILDQPVNFEYDEVPFADVMDDLQSEHGFNTHLDISAQDDSLAEDTLVTMTIKNVRMATGLRLLLKEHNATYMIDDGVMRFISLDVASDPEFHRRQVFDCRALLEKIRTSDPRIGTPLRIQTSQAPGGGQSGGGGGGGIFNFPPNSPPLAQQPGGGTQTASNPAGLVKTAPHTPTIDAPYLLTNLVKNIVAADEWDDTNGDATLTMIGGLMVVNQRQDALDQIESLLNELQQRMKS